MRKKTVLQRGLVAAKAVWREVNGLVEGNAVDNHSFPLEPPVGPFLLGNDEEGVSLVLADFLQDAAEEGPGWVDVGTDQVPVVGKRVASKGGGVVGVGGEVVG